MATAPSLIVALTAALTLAAPGPSHGAQTDEAWKTDFSQYTVPLDEIVSGGPPKDGIPAIDDPRFVSVRAADRWLEDREPVVMVERDGIAKAYPLQILIWHEIVNDQVGSVPVSVTFCPLCNTALAFDRRFADRLLDFGTTGRLRHSDLVMYDRQTETWWQQATGEAIVGQLAGERLTLIAAPTLNWSTFKERYPEGSVLSRETGYSRPYGDNPYAGYDTRRSPILGFFLGKTDDRLPAMERVVALDSPDDPVAYAFSKLHRARAMNDRAGDVPVAVFWAPGMASALDSRTIADGRDVGATGVFDRRVGTRTLTFEAGGDDGVFRDRETGSTWNILGRATSGPLSGTAMSPVSHGNHFWFAWGVFRPETRIKK